MNVSVVAGSLLSGLVLVVSSMQAQSVTADVVLRSGPVAGYVAVGEGYSTYRREPVVVYRRAPARRVVVERYPAGVIIVERVHRHASARHWKRHGFRPVTLYYADGRYYDRAVGRARGMREIVVYERGGRYYADCDDDDHRWSHHGHDWDD